MAMFEAYWKDMVDGYDTLPRSFKKTLPFLLASVLNAEEFLRATLPARNTLFTSPIFARNPLLDLQRENILLGEGNCEEHQMQATGIPPHIEIAKKFKDVTVAMTDFMIKVPDIICDKFRTNVQVTGLQQLTPDAVKECVRATIREEMAIRNFPVRREAETTSAEICSMGSTAVTGEPYATFNWKDGLLWHHVPKDFKWPTGISVKRMWDLWFFGNLDMKILPYGLISVGSDIKDKDDKVARHQADTVISWIMEKIQLPEGKTSISELKDNMELSHQLFHDAYTPLLMQLYDCDEKTAELKQKNAYSTIYCLVIKQDTEGKLGTKRHRRT